MVVCSEACNVFLVFVKESGKYVLCDLLDARGIFDLTNDILFRSTGLSCDNLFHVDAMLIFRCFGNLIERLGECLSVLGLVVIIFLEHAAIRVSSCFHLLYQHGHVVVIPWCPWMGA